MCGTKKNRNVVEDLQISKHGNRKLYFNEQTQIKSKYTNLETINN